MNIFNAKPSCYGRALMLLAALILLLCGSLPGSVAVTRKLTTVGTSPSPQLNVYKQAESYMDDLLANHEAAIEKLGAKGFKKSNVLVVFMCYERGDIIKVTLTSLLMSQGLEGYDLLISQDGLGPDGTLYTLDVEVQETLNALYIHHDVNLCTGLHHHFAKAFAFDMMGYEYLLIVEEDNLIHDQALKFLLQMLEMSVNDREVGLVSITDMDNALLVDESRNNAAFLRTAVDVGHLWVFGVHKSRYDAVKHHLFDYYKLIKGYDYTHTHVWPLFHWINTLHQEKGFPKGIQRTQDIYFEHSLMKEGYTKRLQSMVRLAQPMGWAGVHIKQDPAHFYTTYGQGMYDGRITEEPFELAKNADELAQLQRDAIGRLNVIYLQYLGRPVDQSVSNSAVLKLLSGKMNVVELVRDLINSAEHRRRMKEAVGKRGVKG